MTTHGEGPPTLRCPPETPLSQHPPRNEGG